MDRPRRNGAHRTAGACQGAGRLSRSPAAGIAVGALVLLCCPAVVASADESPPLYELVDAAASRLAAADPVAASKWLSGGPINDPARVRQVLDAVSAQADAAGVPSGYVTTVFADQIDATEAIQYSRFSWWKFDPAAAPTVAPDLAASRATIDELNRAMVAEIARGWPVLRTPGCPTALQQAKTAVAEQRRLDPLYRQALDAATRSYCD